MAELFLDWQTGPLRWRHWRRTNCYVNRLTLGK